MDPLPPFSQEWKILIFSFKTLNLPWKEISIFPPAAAPAVIITPRPVFVFVCWRWDFTYNTGGRYLLTASSLLSRENDKYFDISILGGKF